MAIEMNYVGLLFVFILLISIASIKLMDRRVGGGGII